MTDTDANDEWPLPRYEVPPKDYLHAMGVISLNYNSFEYGLFGIFRHHLVRAKMPGEFSEFLFSEFNAPQQSEAIKRVFQTYESDPEVIAAVDHLMLHFAWCFEARNTLLHAHGNWGYNESLLNGRMPLAKRSGYGYSKLNFIYLSLEHLRAIADSMWEGYNYLTNLFVYLSVRDNLVPSSMGYMYTLFPRTLPRKPPIPKKIKLREQPVTRGNEPPQPEPSQA